MDLLNEAFFEEPKQSRPFPDDDYDKNGKLRRVRGRIFKKLLKYEFKAYFKPMLIVTIALFATAIALCVLGMFLTVEDLNGEGEPLRLIFWALSLFVFVWGLVFLMIFPIILASKRYNKQFFKSEAYLTLSIPATAEEHILAKRLTAYIMMAIASAIAVIAAIIAISPIFVLVASAPDSAPDQGTATIFVIDFFDILYFLITTLLSPLLFLSICGAFCCWRHRGLKTWMIVLMVVALYLFTSFAGVFFGELLFEMSPQTMEVLMEVGRWLGLVLDIGLLYLLFLYETHTIRKKINLK